MRDCGLRDPFPFVYKSDFLRALFAMPRFLSLRLNLYMLTLSLLGLRMIIVPFRPLKGLLSLSPLITFGTISNEMAKGMAIMTLIWTTSDPENLLPNHSLPFKMEENWKTLRRSGSTFTEGVKIPHLWNLEKECHTKNQTAEELLALKTALPNPEKESSSETSGFDAAHQK